LLRSPIELGSFKDDFFPEQQDWTDDKPKKVRRMQEEVTRAVSLE
jgi:hypothetical protein